ncbi:MAG: carbohydrate porin [Endomicrobium sp.]|jgi:hypothetical protein|nr:carbohydrate porin [Endomicrobium sp.]
MNKFASVFTALIVVFMFLGARSAQGQTKNIESIIKGIEIIPLAVIRFQSGDPAIKPVKEDDLSLGYENLGQRTAVNTIFDLGFSKTFEGGAVVFLNIEGSANTQEGAGAIGIPVAAWDQLTWYTHTNGVTELHLTQPFLDDKISVRVGKFWVHTEISQNEAGGDFDSNIFNGDEIFLGKYGAYYGAAVKVSPNEYIGIDAQYQVNDIDNIGWDYAAAELIFKLPIEGNEGNYRIAYWQDNAYGLKKIDNNGNDKRAAASGLVITIDQKIIEGISIFGRYGMPISETIGNGTVIGYNAYTIFGLGFVFSGSLWARTDDSAGIGFGQIAHTGKAADWKFGSIGGSGNDDKSYKSETHFELYYSYKASDAISFVPSIQFIQNPMGGSVQDASTLSYIDQITVFSIRLMYNFQ